MNKPVCIDSHLIIWGIKKEVTIYVCDHVYSYQKKLFTNPSTN